MIPCALVLNDMAASLYEVVIYGGMVCVVYGPSQS